jgi:antirestriction protein ArdC
MQANDRQAVVPRDRTEFPIRHKRPGVVVRPDGKGLRRADWMTLKQALELKAHVHKGEEGSLIVYAERSSAPRLTRTLARKPSALFLHGRRLSRPQMRSDAAKNVRQFET